MATTWNTAFEGTPAGSADPAEGDDRIRELKSATRERIEKEHVMDTGSGLYSEDGWHREGSAIAYYESSAPTNRPDGATALDTDDAGRLWVDSDDRSSWYWDGTAWEELAPPFDGDDLDLSGASNADRSVVFASDAAIAWDEASDRFSINKDWYNPVGGHQPNPVLTGNNKTADEIFDAFAGYMATVDRPYALYGTLVSVSTVDTYYTKVVTHHITYAIRPTATAITLYGVAHTVTIKTGSGGIFDATSQENSVAASVSISDSSPTNYDRVSLALL